ncbi:hypothetical protein CRT60_22685 [Azospirillum palustre]|uniref:Uncharacterized protein n=1 Tax=Azospirillum palustre TaxID=2044885 RepID=A0A2B8B215_9PROT|nr:hypothetical protein CRT60_22685 [Azospirillum palustre]
MRHQDPTFLTLSPIEISRQAAELRTTEQLIQAVLSERVRDIEGLRIVIQGLYRRGPEKHQKPRSARQ